MHMISELPPTSINSAHKVMTSLQSNSTVRRRTVIPRARDSLMAPHLTSSVNRNRNICPVRFALNDNLMASLSVLTAEPRPPAQLRSINQCLLDSPVVPVLL